jgi:hypothetical protein
MKTLYNKYGLEIKTIIQMVGIGAAAILLTYFDIVR